MTKIIHAFTILAICTFCQTHTIHDRSKSSDNSHVINRRQITSEPLGFITKFSWKLFSKTSSENPNSNLILSPISVQLCLTILQQFAAGETLRQFNEVLSSESIDPQIIGNALNSMRSEYSDNELQSASIIFPTINYKLNETFLLNARRSDVEIFPIDFTNIVPAEQTINTWVTNATKGQIDKIVEADLLQGITFMLINAVYFRGIWESEFKTTSLGTFHASLTESQSVTYMTKFSHELVYGEKYFDNQGFGYRWIELPYQKNEYSMIIVLPTQQWTLEKMLDAMTDSDVHDMIYKGASRYPQKELVNLRLPKFKVNSNIPLIPTLKKFGLVDPFAAQSNFPYLANGERIIINNAFQKSVLNVDEKGTVAAAVTVFSGFGASFVSIQRREFDFFVNEPFLSIIVDRKQRLPIFISKVYKPGDSV